MIAPRTRMIVIGVIVPLVIAAAGVITILLSLPELPDPVAVHWGLGGLPDQFGSPAVGLLLLVIPVLGYTAFASFVARYSDDGAFTFSQRIVLAAAPFFSAVLTTSMAGALLVQRGLADAHDAPSILPVLGVAFGSGTVLTVLAWLALPAMTPTPEREASALPTMNLAATERATWMQRIGPSRPVGVILALVGLLAVLGGGLVLWFAAPAWTVILYLGIMTPLAVLVGGSLFWHVTIDARGFAARSATGFPRFVIPLAEVEAATAVDVRAARDFGGWGVRWGGPKRMGVITRGGEAIEVRRRDGRILVVTVSHAAVGAALLNSLARRA